MAVSVEKAGPYYSSGSISFSSLRTNFRAKIRREGSADSETKNNALDTGSISASELFRNTDTSEVNPIVPDSTENANIASYDYPNGYSSIDKTALSDLSIEDFRNSIKFYYVILPSSDTELNFDIDSQSWNSNLNKNVNKVAFIDGVCGSNNTASRAARFVATAYNITIDVYGSILGAGGAGGTSSTISGGDGGDALRVESNNGNNVVVNVRSGGSIYGGGGGGEKGVSGDAGSKGTCTKVENDVQGPSCGACPSCSGGTQSNCRDTDCCQSYSYCCGAFNCGCTACSQYVKKATCTYTKDSSTPPAPAGGDGGKGRGYDNPVVSIPLFGDISLKGGTGGSKECPTCDSGYSLSGGSCSTKGNNGGNGGDWGSPGNNTTNTGDGGDGGDAIVGSNYSVTGSTGTDNIKGGY